MADSVKGNHYLYFEKEIQKGVLLHRFIDSFTDFHPTYRKSKHRLHTKYGHYSGVIMDIFYDHFLAKNWTKYQLVHCQLTHKIFIIWQRCILTNSLKKHKK